MAYIGPEPKLGQNREVDDISSGFNGNTATFNLQVDGLAVSPGSANAILVSLGGVIQNPGTDYTVSTSTITFTTNPASGLSFFGLVLGQGIDTATVADGSVTNAKVSGSAAIAVSKLANFVTNNADNRVITGSDTANTLNAESGVVINSNGYVGIGITNPDKTGIQNNVKVLQLDGGDGAEIILGNSVSQNVSSNHIGAIAFKNIDTSTGNAPHYAGIRSNCTDTSGNMDLKFYTGTTNFEANTPQMLVDANGNLKIDSGFGSATTVYGVRAWIKFNGVGTVAITGSGNISALTDNGTGDYTVTFSTAMPDTNYAAVGIGSSNGGNGAVAINTSGNTPLLYSTTQCRFCNSNTNNGTLLDGGAIGAAFIR